MNEATQRIRWEMEAQAYVPAGKSHAIDFNRFSLGVGTAGLSGLFALTSKFSQAGPPLSIVSAAANIAFLAAAVREKWNDRKREKCEKEDRGNDEILGYLL